MENTNGSLQGRNDETEIAETVATTLENPEGHTPKQGFLGFGTPALFG